MENVRQYTCGKWAACGLKPLKYGLWLSKAAESSNTGKSAEFEEKQPKHEGKYTEHGKMLPSATMHVEQTGTLLACYQVCYDKFSPINCC